MIISRGRRYIFVHIPKTGGTALSLALEDRAMKDDILIGDTPKALKRRARLKGVTASGRLWKHSGLADILGLVTPEEIESFLVFTLVRNPWDRLVSYYFWLRAQRFPHPAVTLAQALDFSGFLNHPETIRSVEAAPYGSYLRLPEGREKCDLWLRLEHLDRDLAPLEAHLGFRLAPLQRFNASDRDRDWRAYYCDADADLVGRICAGDARRFGYSFAG